MSKKCFEVEPIGRAKLMALTESIRTFFRLEGPFCPILQVVELGFPRVQGFERTHITIGEHDEMGDRHGLTFPEEQEIRLRVDVYDGVEANKGRDRFTLAHELGHLLLHSKPGLARTMRESSEIEPFRSSEWQADTFAGCLLMPITYLQTGPSISEIATTCGVSIDAATTHTRLLRKAGMLR